jgi:hypothetical protein
VRRGDQGGDDRHRRANKGPVHAPKASVHLFLDPLEPAIDPSVNPLEPIVDPLEPGFQLAPLFA